MTLREWLDAQPAGALARLAKETGIDYRSLCRYAAKTKAPRVPPLDRAIDIERATRGEVSIADMTDKASKRRGAAIESPTVVTLRRRARPDRSFRSVAR